MKQRTRIGRTSSEFDSCVLIRVFLVLLLRDVFLDTLRSSLLLEEVRRFCLDRVELLREC